MSENTSKPEKGKFGETDAEKSVFRFVDPRVRSEEFSATARSVVKHGASVVVETAAKVRAKADAFVGGAEQSATAAVSGVAGVGRHVVEASFANLAVTAGMVDKLSDAKTVVEALRIEGDYVREIVKQNLEQIATATSLMSGVFASTMKTVGADQPALTDKAA